jgi:glyoxylase-like metal-dependent hydrolase (beta-lactamase superfamily II)
MASVRYLDGRIDVFAYLVITDDDVLLIDSGVGEGNAYIDEQFDPVRSSMSAALSNCGVRIEEVTLLVNSHLHFDHCGNNRLFPQAEVYVQRAELKAARTRSYTVREWFEYPTARIKPVAGDLELRKGIRLLATPGHTPGHQSVLIENPTGNTLIAAQAAYTAAEFRAGGEPESQAHEGLAEEYRQSIARLKEIDCRWICFSHDEAAAAD